MSIDVTKENICINKIVGQKSENLVVEGDIIVPDIKPDILNAISTTGNICIYKKEVLDGKIRIDGDVNVYIMYLADNEEAETRSLNTNIDFTQVMDFDGCNTQMSLDENIEIKAIECKVLNGRKINVKATLQVDAKIYSNENVDIIKEVNNLCDVQSLKSELQINSLIGEGMSKTYAKDTIVIDNIDNLAEVLKVELSITNKDTKISYNKVLAKADVNAKILYLTEDNRIRMTENKIPVMGFVDIENINDDSLCDMKYKLKNILVKPNSVEEHSVYIEAEIELYCRAYENKQIQIIQDLYSPSQDLVFNQRNINTMSGKCNISDTCNIRQKISVSELNGNPIYDVCTRPVILAKNVTNGKVSFEGEVQIELLYASNNLTSVDTKQCIVPFEFTMNAENINSSCDLETQLQIQNQDFIVGADGYIDAKIDLEFNLSISKTIAINIIDEVNIDESRQREIYSMIIYFVKPNDTLWNIAKRFRSTVEDIVRVNNIEDENKIYPGQQLFIPKYVYTKKEVSA